MRITTSNVWARSLTIENNPVRQLLVRAETLDIAGTDDTPEVVGRYGRWPASRSVATGNDGPLTARIPAVHASDSRVQWVGSRALTDPGTVRESYVGAIGFRESSEPHSLRRPQIGALHSVIGYWSSGLSEPGIVVMPTGTGKTETMLALLVATRPTRLLVVVPTSALRDQIASKFETLGILQKEQIVAATALRPCVARLEHGIKDVADVDLLTAATNVLVATPHAVSACAPEARERLLASFSHLMVDEAHHAPAPSWASIIAAFADRKVLLFTATPFREDSRPIPGRTIYRFPLREAQQDGYFTTIDYKNVVSLEDTDNVLADLAIARLRADLAAGHDHILMARARSETRAKELGKLYRSKAADLGPEVLYHKLSPTKRTAVMKALNSRECRIVVCVDMLGEGFDLPSLKIAALHDVKKSLSPMIQFIGRFTRSVSESSKIGTAAAFVARDPSTALSPLRELLREDADWNLILRDMTDRATQTAENITAFDTSFTGGPDEVTTPSLEPKMSAIAHRASIPAWNPEAALDLYGRDHVLDGRIALGGQGSLAWLVLEHRDEVRWGDVQTLKQLTYELIVLYFDQRRRLLYIHSSERHGDYADLAEAVLGKGTHPFTGPNTFRVLARLGRLIPTNVGLLDTRDHFNRFSMHVGSDVLEALTEADKQGKSQTHIATSGFNDGERVTVSAALSGRFWSMATAPNLKAWKDWCDQQGEKLLDDTIDLKEIFAGFIIPQELSQRPPHVLLAAEWPWEFYTGTGTYHSLTVDDKPYPLTDVEFVVDNYYTTGPFLLSLTTPAWRIAYQADFGETGLVYSPVDRDGHVTNRRETVPLQEWINKHKPYLFLAGDRLILPDDRLLEPQYERDPFDRGRFTTLDWAGVDITVESQGTTRRADSIQAYMSAYLQKRNEFDILLDDDRKGEAADLVGLQVDGTDLHITLVHCKYSSEPSVGARLKDLYEVCGQAIRGAKWRQHGAIPLLHHLDRRAKRYHARTGESPYEIGDIEELYRLIALAPQLKPRVRTVIAQPGLSVQAATTEHLRVIAGAESYVRIVTAGTFEFYCHG